MKVEELEDLLSEPTPEAIEDLRRAEGDILVLGAGGKMGPTLARMAVRASREAGSRREVFAVSRFSNPQVRRKLEGWGVRTVSADLLSRDDARRLPRAPNAVFMAGRKFGSTGSEALTWAMNTIVPANVCEELPETRFVVFSTGNVYGLCPVERGGSVESDEPRPEGDYAMSCLGRERVFEHYAEARGTPVAILRLNYACDLRYGVLVDLARKVLAGEPVDVSMGHFNTIWQADANAAALRLLRRASAPPLVLNVTGLETLRVRDVCLEFGRIFVKSVNFLGIEMPEAFLANAEKARRLLGPPRMASRELLERVAEWILGGGELLGKPTRFEVRDGKF